MCGGEGSRLDTSQEKPLYPIDAVPMVDRVLVAITESHVDHVYAAVSPNTPATRDHLDGRDDVTPIETAGDGYVADLISLLDRPEIEPPVLTVAADLPLLERAVIDRVLDRSGAGTEGDEDAEAPSRTVCVPVALKRRLGVSIDSRLDPETHLAPTGVNIVGRTEQTMTDVYYDPRLAVNVNRRDDAAVATDRLSNRERRRFGGDDQCA